MLRSADRAAWPRPVLSCSGRRGARTILRRPAAARPPRRRRAPEEDAKGRDANAARLAGELNERAALPRSFLGPLPQGGPLAQ